jgi:multiple sugar transport system permease protein
LFIGYPFFNGLLISTQSFDYLRPEQTRFVGLQNYVDIFTPGQVVANEFWNAVKNTLTFVLISVPPLVLIPLGLAILLNTRTPGRNVYRAIYFAPWVLSVSVVGLLWWWIFQSQGGLLNYYLASWNMSTPRWLTTMPWAWITILVATVWWTMGFNMIIILAALQDIPQTLYEAGAIDGATGWQMFTNITLPMLRSILIFIIVITIIASFNLLGQPFFMTNGGPPQPNGGGATEPVMLRIYIEGFVRPFQGIAAAMSVIVATMILVFSFINFKLFRTRD